MIEMGLIDSSWDLSYDDIVSWKSLSKEKRKEMDLRMAIYAAMIDRMDQNIGRLINNLKSKGLYDNTIIDFFDVEITYIPTYSAASRYSLIKTSISI